MGDNISEIGKLENNMEKAFMLLKTEKENKDYGKMEKELNG
jgi:hypothetical protein